MKTILKAAAAALTIAGASAQATTLDFAGYADTFGERGLAQGEILTVDGVNLAFAAFLFDSAAGGYVLGGNAYLDAGNAGLGNCSAGLTPLLQCSTPSDDNVTEDEAVGFAFLDGPFDANGFTFRGANHGLLGGTELITIAVLQDSGLATMTNTINAFNAMAASGDAFFSALLGIGFANAGTQFYVSAVDVDPSAVPVPAAGLLFLTGAAGLAARRRLAVEA